MLTQVILAKTPNALVTVQQPESDKPEGAAAVVIDDEQSGDVSPQDDASDLPTVNEDDAANEDRITNDNNILLDPDILTDQVTQVLVLTVMATLVKYTTNESEVRILYEYLAEASIVFPKVFPVIHSLLVRIYYM